METTIGIGKKNDKQETMDSAAYLNPTIIINTKFGNVKDSYNNVVLDERRQILEPVSSVTPRERHPIVSEGYMDGVGDWLLRTNEFEKWRRCSDKAVYPVLSCYGDPRVGKTYLKCVMLDILLGMQEFLLIYESTELKKDVSVIDG